jgi:hypothetical protein
MPINEFVQPEIVSPFKFTHNSSHSQYFCNNCHKKLVDTGNKHFIVDGAEGSKMDSVTKSKMFE